MISLFRVLFVPISVPHQIHCMMLSQTTELATNPHLIRSPVRYALNYKKLPYKTAWVEYHEIEPVAKKLGAKATRLKPNG